MSQLPGSDGHACSLTRGEALLDAAVTVQRWQRLFPAIRWAPSDRNWNVRVLRNIAEQLGCYTSWGAIQAEIARRNFAIGREQIVTVSHKTQRAT